MRIGLGPRLVAAGMLPVIGVAVALDLVLGARSEETVQDEVVRELGRLLGVTLTGVAGLEVHDVNQASRFVDGVGRAAGLRITLIAPDGRVLADSHVPLERLATLDNHASRPEVAQALREGAGQAVRYSQTVSAPLMYAARLGEARDGPVVVRLALPLVRLAERRAEVRRTVVTWTVAGLGLCGAVMAGLAWTIVRRLGRIRHAAERMARGDYAVRVEETGSPDEVALTHAINRLAGATAETIARLDDERKRLRTVLDAMNDGVAVTDAQGRVVLCNRVLRETWEGASEGRAVTDFLRAPEALDVVRAALAGRAGVCETSVAHPRSAQVLLSASPMPKGDGAVVVLHDTTEVHRLHRVRRDFVANVSHELRSPIATLLAAAETLRDLEDGGSPDSRRHAIETIERHARRLGALVSNLLDLSRLESGQHGYSSRPVPLAAVIETILSEFHDRAQAKSLALTQAVEPPDLAALCDPEGLAVVLRNLVDNAVRYTRPGDSIRVSAKAEPGDKVSVLVSDTGPGIEEVHLPRLFERFYRVDRGRSRDQGGTGLGLAIARHAAVAMGGTLEVRSAVGSGTTFQLILPQARSGVGGQGVGPDLDPGPSDAFEKR